MRIQLRHSKDWLLGVTGGVLLALMIHCNSDLARNTTPFYAAWVAHGLGTLVSFSLILIQFNMARGEFKEKGGEKLPFWFYLGGVPGVFTVILAAITVNSGLKLSGSISLMLLGQVVFGIFSDTWGLFGIKRRSIGAADFLVAGCVLVGSALVIFGRT